MFLQLAIGTGLVGATIVLVAIFIGTAIQALNAVGAWFVSPPRLYKTLLSLACVALWLMAALTLSVWAWSALFLVAGIFDTIEASLYFSVVTFTTLGFGDVTLPLEWRLLSGICAANGLLLFGLSTAFLVEFFRRLMEAGSPVTLKR